MTVPRRFVFLFMRAFELDPRRLVMDLEMRSAGEDWVRRSDV